MAFANLQKAVFILLAFCACSSASYADERPKSAGLSGFTYTQDNIFIPRSQGSQIANIHIYGWGAFWPFSEGNPKENDGGAVIEQRIKQAENDGQEVMLTCATAPSMYRKSGKMWNMEERVMDGMEDQYARRCAEAVARWPQITRVQVWNELKGYWLMPPDNRWDYQSYTRFYNKVYRAVKAVRKDVLLGGGYAALSSQQQGFDKVYNGVMIDSRAMDAMQYWLTHAQGYDAVCLDGSFAPKDFVKASHLFRKLSQGKPIWWSEYYSHGSKNMRVARQYITQDQQPGDIALWWASKHYSWQ